MSNEVKLFEMLSIAMAAIKDVRDELETFCYDRQGQIVKGWIIIKRLNRQVSTASTALYLPTWALECESCGHEQIETHERIFGDAEPIPCNECAIKP